MNSSGRRRALAFAWIGAALFLGSLLYFFYSYLVRFGRPGSSNATGAVVLDVVLFSVFAFHHSLFARSGAKAFVSRLVSPLLERSVYVWVSSALFMAVCWLWRPVPGELYNLEGLAEIPGLVVQLVGLVLTIRASAAIDPLDLAGVRPVREVAADGESITAPRHVPLETTGLYGFVRHPLYFAWALFVFGTPHMTMTRFVFATVSCLYLAVAIPFEERGLIKLFGAEYEAYRRVTRWRMIPGVY
jgi:protein-S-isoprenylcysteine O-methyltransferase Ste14